jgi:predicted AAA+ superfamily ATPase
MPGKDKFDHLVGRLEGLLDRVEKLTPAGAQEPDWSSTYAFRWRKHRGGGYIQAVMRPHHIRLDDLRDIDRQRDELDRNTRQFLNKLPANNALLWGSRGTGKSSLVKALVNEYRDQGLRVLEVDKNDLIDLPDVVEHIQDRPERFLLFCDDLSFESDDSSYKAMKAILDGSVHAPPENVLIYATSNRRHLLPEYMSENLDAHHVNGEIHHSEAVEEKISLSERFGLWLSFYPFKQEQYLGIVAHWLKSFHVESADSEAVRAAALQWALARGSRSGRSAYQFARDWAGRQGLS